MATLRDGLLPAIDSLRGIPNTLGFRRYTVTLRSRTWGGAYPGELGTTNTDVDINPPPRVRVVTTQEVASSGGTYRLGDFRIDAITPRYTTPTTGGFTPAQLNIRPGTIPQDVAIILTGDEAAPIECEAVEFRFDRAFRYTIIARQLHGPIRG